MNSDTQHPIDLLPWYVNGSLSDPEKQAIKTHLASCATCQEEVDFLTLIRSQVKNAAPTSKPGELSKSRLMKEIRQNQPENTNQHNEGKTKAREKLWLSWQTWASLAAALIIVIQTSVILKQPAQPVLPPIQLLGKAPEFSVQFQDNATIKTINNFLMTIKGRIVNGPIESSDGNIFYEIDLEAITADSPVTVIKAWADKIRARRHAIKYVNTLDNSQ